MAEQPWPWIEHGGSFVWRDGNPMGLASMPGRCCERMTPKLVGGCREGCCDDYECQVCGRRWRYEWPD